MTSLFKIAIVPLLAIAPLFASVTVGDARSYPTLSRSEILELQNLAFPQSQAAMYSRFGPPAYKSDHYDYYPAGRNAMARIAYVGRRAQSVEWWVER